MTSVADNLYAMNICLMVSYIVVGIDHGSAPGARLTTPPSTGPTSERCGQPMFNISPTISCDGTKTIYNIHIFEANLFSIFSHVTNFTSVFLGESVTMHEWWCQTDMPVYTKNILSNMYLTRNFRNVKWAHFASFDSSIVVYLHCVPSELCLMGAFQIYSVEYENQIKETPTPIETLYLFHLHMDCAAAMCGFWTMPSRQWRPPISREGNYLSYVRLHRGR